VANAGSGNVSLLRGTGGGGFAPAAFFGAGSSPMGLASGDFDRDALPDIAVANSGADNVSLLRNTTAALAQFGFGPATGFSATGGGTAVTIGDLDRDGKPDLVGFLPDVAVLLGSGTGSFGPASPFNGGEDAVYGGTLGDLNLDGKLDAVAVNDASFGTGSDDEAVVLLGTGTGSLGTATPYPVGDSVDPQSVAVGDLNLDGKPDLAVANEDTGNVSVLLGTGTGSFGPATDYSAFGGEYVAIGDLNLDGKPDLAVASGAAKVSVLLGTGTGSFGPATDYDVGMGGRLVAIGDLDLDGKPDLAVANFESDDVSVLLGTGTGSFGAATGFGVGDGPGSVAIGDLDLDGKPDLAVSNFNSDDLAILRGTGTGSFGAASNLGAADAANSVAIGDVNRDAKPDLTVAGSGKFSVLLNTSAPAADQGGSAPPGGPGPGGRDAAPVVEAFTMVRRTFRAARAASRPAQRRRTPVGTAFRYRLSEAASVRIAIERATPGRRVGRRCRRATRRLRRRRACVRWLSMGALQQAGRQDSNILPFRGRVGRRKLRQGRHRATIVATDAAGNRSRPRRLTFRVVRR
jgi:hypothetical protein